MIKIRGKPRPQLPQIKSLQNLNGITKIHSFIFSFNAIILSTFRFSKLMLYQRFTH
jgi:hypothetical protein